MAADIPEIREIQEGQITTVVAEDLEIKGTVRFKSSVMLKGVFEGEIFSEGLLVVGPTRELRRASIRKRSFLMDPSRGMLSPASRSSSRTLQCTTAISIRPSS
jgi:hypothetical protein